jgi:hypothetical protein
MGKIGVHLVVVCVLFLTAGGRETQGQPVDVRVTPGWGTRIPGSNKLRFEFKGKGCPACKDVDVNTDENIAVVIGFLTTKLNTLQTQLSAREAEIKNTASTLWRADSKLAIDRGTTYDDPSSATTQSRAITARLAYMCKSIGLDAECN